MNYFFNAPDDVVDQGLSSLARIAPIRCSERDSGVRLVIHSGHDNNQVAVLSGGGAGHEPAHAGFVGQGMLTGAIVGDLFASPSVEAVLAAIRQTCGEAGCLLIVKNYTGDRLNFGLAAEKAAREGYQVRSVLVADDISLPEAVQARGLAGTVLVHKIAGYHAAQGADLDTVADAAQHAADNLCSIGIALSSATLPGQDREPRSPELGLGIHNEPGVAEVDPSDAADAVRMVLEPLLAKADARFGDQASFVVLLNNLGGCSTQEIGVLLDECLAQLPRDRVAAIVVPAPLMTSINMHGFSLTLMPADNDILEALRAPVSAVAWPGLRDITTAETFAPSLTDRKPPGGGARDEQRAQWLQVAIAALIDARQELDDLDAKTGDGDTGSTFADGAKAIRQALEDDALSTGDDAMLADEIGDILSLEMGGSSGVLLSILFTATAVALREGATAADALARGADKMQEYGGAQRGDRTLLDALLPAIGALQDSQSLAEVAKAARAGADETAEIAQAGAGRSAYVRDDALSGVIDPGAEAVARVWEALASG
ncbi:MAG: dihydroxyacetone kinase subunit DhaK [Salinisphaera sp.]|jgi:ATP-dependent dihydroxyacetone kinase|nr:dihydroxyacetone kinase subunit DhaK [Salinisphaera sp.]